MCYVCIAQSICKHVIWGRTKVGLVYITPLSPFCGAPVSALRIVFGYSSGKRRHKAEVGGSMFEFESGSGGFAIY
jgi:hypothetical protein